MRIEIGDRVQTPEGPGTVVGTEERLDRFYRPPRKVVYVMVEPDGGPRARRWRYDQLADPGRVRKRPETPGPNDVEDALAVERDQERRHGEP